MLNISENSVGSLIPTDRLKSPAAVRERKVKRGLRRTLVVLMLMVAGIMFLPWTQTVPGTGRVTTLKPDQRPQELHSAIAGQISKWFVREGDFVEEGDTLLFIKEIKEDYFDPQLLERTQSRIEAKDFSVDSYKEKVIALENRISALQTSKGLKMTQSRNKIKQAQLKILSDSIDTEASRTNYHIADHQYARQEKLYNEGLKSLTELEARRLKLQEAQAKLISAENKLLTSRNELLNAQVDLSSVANDYDEKIAKAKAEKYETLSGRFDAEAEVTKLRNAYSNYSVRSGLYYIRAPQSGYVTRTLKTGIGETIKEGEEILTIMPATYDIAVEMYIQPMNLPLVRRGTEVRLVFDGWPAMVFSGWPGVSTGTFGGRVVAVDNFASSNGKFRLLVAPDEEDAPWPEALRVGSGANGLALLNDVPVWYEIWRQLNGFPPEYYSPENGSKTYQNGKNGDKKGKDAVAQGGGK